MSGISGSYSYYGELSPAGLSGSVYGGHNMVFEHGAWIEEVPDIEEDKPKCKERLEKLSIAYAAEAMKLFHLRQQVHTAKVWERVRYLFTGKL